MKNIVICCDGTWNTPDQKDGGVPDPTNVVRIYNAAAEGEWLDSSIKCGPAGPEQDHFQPAELGQIAGSALGHVETWFKKLTKNKAADFRFTKRHEEYRWFSLIGVIANGEGVDIKGYLIPHETFLIGNSH